MIVLALRFPAGRFHATPWNRHVNEGAVEWPPAPWRLLRALVATWHLKAPELPPSVVQALIDSLAAEAPHYHLPPASTGHTRHYMPDQSGKTAKIFDTFVQTNPHHWLYIVWDHELDAPARQALTTLVERIGYLGRAEALAEAQLLDKLPSLDKSYTLVRPATADTSRNEACESIRLLCLQTPEMYAAWRTEFNARNSTNAKAKKGKKAKSPILPETIFDALHVDTVTLQKEGWNLPPCTRYIEYLLPENLLSPPPRSPRRKSAEAHPQVARFEIAGNVLPRLTQTISVAGRIHKTLCKLSDFGQGSLQVFSGRDADGKPFPGHRHAHILCEPGSQRDAIAYVTVYAEMGFDEDAQKALRLLTKTWGKGGHDLRFILHGIGSVQDFADTLLFRPARYFRSLTPFYATRHVKTYSDGRPKIDTDNGFPIGSAPHDLRRLIALSKDLPMPDIGKPHHHVSLPNGRRLRCLQFQTSRDEKGPARGQLECAAFELRFSQELNNPRPLTFGYGAHFGLGLFVPVADETLPAV